MRMDEKVIENYFKMFHTGPEVIILMQLYYIHNGIIYFLLTKHVLKTMICRYSGTAETDTEVTTEKGQYNGDVTLN